MRIAVCEDLDGDAAVLREYINDYFARMGYTGEVTTYGTGEALLGDFSPGLFDFLFLDIYLPGISGMEAAREIRKQDGDCRIIFITKSPDYSMDGFEVYASGYLLKPIDKAKMDRALHMCRDLFLQSARTIEFPVGRESTVPVPVTGIQYVEVYNKAVRLHLNSGTLEARLTLEEVEAMLGGEPFLRCHRSYIVNMNHVAKISADDFVMQSGALVPMRINGKKAVKLAYAEFMAGRAASRRTIG